MSATSSTAGHWQSLRNIYFDDPYFFAPYTLALGLGLSDAHHADTLPIIDTQPLNYDIHHQVQSLGVDPDVHSADSPPIAQPAHYDSDIYRWLEPHFGPEYFDDPYSFAPYTLAPGLGLSDAHRADTLPITDTQPLNYDIHHQVQSLGVDSDVHSSDSPPIAQPAHYDSDIYRWLELHFGPEADAHLADLTPITHINYHQIQLPQAGSPHASGRPYTCMWHDNGSQLCGQTAAKGVARHMATFHFIRGETHYVCQWKGCQRSKPYRKDTICRHIREVHLGERRRYS